MNRSSPFPLVCFKVILLNSVFARVTHFSFLFFFFDVMMTVFLNNGLWIKRTSITSIPHTSSLKFLLIWSKNQRLILCYHTQTYLKIDRGSVRQLFIGSVRWGPASSDTRILEHGPWTASTLEKSILQLTSPLGEESKH